MLADRSSVPKVRPEGFVRGQPDRGVRRRNVFGGVLLAIALASVGLPLLGRSIYLVPDSAGYLVWAHSLFWDRDLDFSNDYARFGALDREGDIAFAVETSIGRRGNPFGMGSALLWAPWLAVAAIISHLVPGASTDGFGNLLVWAAQLGSWTCVLAALCLVWASLTIAVPDLPLSSRCFALAGAFLGTPLPYYVLQQGTYSHASSVFAVSLVFYLALRWRRTWSAGRAVMLGAVTGLATLVRLQDVLFIAVPPLLAVWGGGLRSRRAIRSLALYLAVAVLVTLPQLLAWKWIYGGFGIPQGAGFLHFDASRLLLVLVASRHGLFSWSPVAALGLLGLVLLARSSATRGLAFALGLGFALQWFVNALPVDWWAGWSFGARRFLGCVPLLAIGLAALARGRQAWHIVIATGTIAGLLQWARVASGLLSGDVDPGWNGLWGSGFWTSLAAMPDALVRLFSRSWIALRVFRQPQATPPDLYTDPNAAIWLLYATWAVAILGSFLMWTRGRRSAGGL